MVPHNAASLDAMMRAIGQHIPYDSMVVIFGCCADKDVAGMLERITSGADKVIFTKVDNIRSADPSELAAQYIELYGKMAQVARDAGRGPRDRQPRGDQGRPDLHHRQLLPGRRSEEALRESAGVVRSVAFEKRTGPHLECGPVFHLPATPSFENDVRHEPARVRRDGRRVLADADAAGVAVHHPASDDGVVAAEVRAAGGCWYTYGPP